MPELNIAADDYAYIKAAVAKASYREIGGLGVVVVEDGKPIIKHMRLLEQTVSSSEVDWGDNGEAHAEYLTWLYTPVEEGGVGFEGERYGIYSWHSHGNMSVFYSGTDENFISGVGRSVPWVFSSVYNNKGDSTHRLDVFPKVSDLGCELLEDRNDARQQITWKDSKLFILQDENELGPIVDELENLEIAHEMAIATLESDHKKAVEELKKDYKESIKPFNDLLTEGSKIIQGRAKERLEADYKQYVTTGYGFASGPKGTTVIHGGSGTKKHQSQTNLKTDGDGSDGSSNGKKVDAGGRTDQTEAAADVEYVFDPKQTYRCFDEVSGLFSDYTVQEIILCDDLHPSSAFEAELVDSLSIELGMILITRTTYMEYVDQTRDQLH